MPWIEDSGEDRRSCELRYTIQATPDAADAPDAEEEKEDDAGLGALFDDSPDSEAESEPGSPHIMSAAWVERMARDPGLQRTLQRGGMPPGFDIVSSLERLDLAERRQLIYVGARREEAEAMVDAARAEVAEAQRRFDAAERRRDAAVAEANRRTTERHANDQFPAGG